MSETSSSTSGIARKKRSRLIKHAMEWTRRKWEFLPFNEVIKTHQSVYIFIDRSPVGEERERELARWDVSVNLVRLMWWMRGRWSMMLSLKRTRRRRRRRRRREKERRAFLSSLLVRRAQDRERESKSYPPHLIRLLSVSFSNRRKRERRIFQSAPNSFFNSACVDADRMLSLVISLHLFILICSTQSLETIQVTLASTVELPCSISSSNESIHPAKVTKKQPSLTLKRDALQREMLVRQGGIIARWHHAKQLVDDCWPVTQHEGRLHWKCFSSLFRLSGFVMIMPILSVLIQW